MPRKLDRRHFPWLALAASLLLTAAATTFVVVTGSERDRAQFDNAVQSTRDRIAARLVLYEAMLQATAAFYSASDTIMAPEFKRYAQQLRLRKQYPGIQGIGITARLPAEAMRAAEQSIRVQRGDTSFRIWPAQPRAEYHPIVLLEPGDAPNRRAIGYDMFSDPVRRAAMARARDQGGAALSGRVRLVQEFGPVPQAGFLMYYPLYARAAATSTVAQRRSALQGYVYAPFRANDLFEGIFGSELNPRVRFRVYDDTVLNSRALLHDSRFGAGAGVWRRHDPKYEVVDRLTIGGRTWTIGFSSLPVLEVGSVSLMAPAIALAGLIVSAIIFLLSMSQSRERKRAEKSEAARSRFFTAMSHELRTPVNAIMGYNDLLLAGLYGPLSDAQRGGVERGHTAARHLAELVNDVLDLSKLEAGKIELTPEAVDLRALLAELATTLTPLMERHGCTLVLDVPEPREGGNSAEGIPSIVTDPRRVRQILLNLLSNAAKFGRGKQVEVQARRHGPDQLAITVRDHGPGIPLEAQRRIFDEFVQLDAGRSEGTGLGLAISRRLAESLGGHMEVQSEEGQGSAFTLVLPQEFPRGPGWSRRGGGTGSAHG